MNDEELDQTAALLRRMSGGDPQAAEELMPIVFDELHRIADRLMRKQRVDHTLQPTALINEAFLKLVRIDDVGWEGRAHFLRVAASAMRSVLIDHARAQATQKRNENRRPVTLHDDLAADRSEAAHVLAVHEGIEALSAIDEQLADIVELRFFGGFSNEEIAKLLEVSLRAVERGWQFARTWLREHLASVP